MSDRIFIWVAHPRAGSLCESLGEAYEAGARNNGAEVRRMTLSDMSFESDGFDGYGPDAPALEPDLRAWQEAMNWADHVVVIHPYWWAAMPARAKAVLDRALTSGFAFKYHRKGVRWDKLLTGKTADVIVTSDTPPWLDTLLYGYPARRVLKNQVLGFCGIKTKKVVQLGSVKTASAKKIKRWITQAERLGRKAAGRSLTAPLAPQITGDAQ